MTPGILRRSVGEGVGTALLLAAIVGSGVMAERLAGGNGALALLANSIATGGALFALILTFAPISGAHFNPLVTIAAALSGELRPRHVLPYVVAQTGGAILGVWLAHLMFDLPIIEASAHERSGIGQWAGEFTATFGLLALVEAGKRHFRDALPAAIAAYITAAYWFTSSTSFANPAVTLARALTDSFAGIRPQDAPGFIVAQLAATGLAVVALPWMFEAGDTPSTDSASEAAAATVPSEP